MIDVEALVCEVPKYHKNCKWINAKLHYPNGQYLLLRDRLIRETKKTKTAFRIVHWKFGVLVSIKMGHDDILWVGEREDALRQFALYGGD